MRMGRRTRAVLVVLAFPPPVDMGLVVAQLVSAVILGILAVASLFTYVHCLSLSRLPCSRKANKFAVKSIEHAILQTFFLLLISRWAL